MNAEMVMNGNLVYLPELEDSFEWSPIFDL
jgi:hypothetical protein